MTGVNEGSHSNLVLSRNFLSMSNRRKQQVAEINTVMDEMRELLKRKLTSRQCFSWRVHTHGCSIKRVITKHNLIMKLTRTQLMF